MQRKTIVILGCSVLALAMIGASVLLGLSGEGQINITERIATTDQTEFKEQVTTETRAVVPNGGLTPQGSDPVPEPPKPIPEAPPQDAASSTDAEGGDVEGTTEESPVTEEISEPVVEETPAP